MPIQSRHPMAWLERRRNCWYAAWRDAAGRTVRRRAYPDKEASRQLLARLNRERAQGAEGLLDPYREHKATPIGTHLDDYLAELKTLGRDPVYVGNIRLRLNKLFAACEWSKLSDVSADSFERWRQKQTTVGPVTLNQFLQAIRTFLNWCVDPAERLPGNPLIRVKKVNAASDIRRERRALTLDEIGRLLKAASADHAIVYRFILATGLRRAEATALTWGDVHLTAIQPHIVLRASTTKSGREATLPLRADIAAELKTIRRKASDADRVFPSLPSMDQHKEYLDAARIPFADSGGRRADFHALRHTFGTLLSRSGVAPRVAQELMRHSDIKLTMKTYTDARLFDPAGAVAKLPSFGGKQRTRGPIGGVG
jgi:integrase